MPFKDPKVVQVLLAEASRIRERCDGYQDEMRHLTADVLNFEREHEIVRGPVVKKIEDKVTALGELLHKARTASDVASEDGE